MSGEPSRARQDGALRRGLFEMVLNYGQGFRWQGLEVTEKMVLAEWARSFKQPEYCATPFASRAEWEAFSRALAYVRARPSHLLAWGEEIEARQRPHAERMGWT